MLFLAVQDRSIGDLFSQSVSVTFFISASSEHNDLNDYNDYNDYKNYNDYIDSDLDLDLVT